MKAAFGRLFYLEWVSLRGPKGRSNLFESERLLRFARYDHDAVQKKSPHFAIRINSCEEGATNLGTEHKMNLTLAGNFAILL